MAVSIDRAMRIPKVLDRNLAGKTGVAEAALDREGFAHVSGICTAEEVGAINGILERLWRKRAGFKEGNQFDLVSADDESGKPMKFPQIINPHEFAPELRKTAFFKRAEAMAKELLGPEARFSFDHALRKAPLDGPATPWHQDVAFRDASLEYRELSFWLALQPTTIENGCMCFIPRSHQWGILDHRPLGNDPRVHVLECCGDFDRDSAVYVPLAAGDCTIHTGLTLHGAGPNVSNGYRAGYVAVFELPPRPAAAKIDQAWLVNRQTTRQMRARQWRAKRLNVLVRAWRYMRRTELTSMQGWRDIGAQMSRLGRSVAGRNAD